MVVSFRTMWTIAGGILLAVLLAFVLAFVLIVALWLVVVVVVGAFALLVRWTKDRPTL